MPESFRELSKRAPRVAVQRLVAAFIAIVAFASLYLLYLHVERETEAESKMAKAVAKASKDAPHLSIEGVKRTRIAYAITMTGDGPFADGAAVLAYSILKVSRDKDYDVSLIAFVHPDVKTSRGALKKIGYHVIECPTPINVTTIKFDFLREKINKNGCCGAKELIKLNAYRLMQYDRVVHVDADTYFVNPIDDLLIRNYSLIYTTDPNMATYHKKIEYQGVQGGFLVLRPSVDDYRGMMDVMLHTEFKIYEGWNSSLIGWHWGGMTVQGVVPYYYYKVSDPTRTQIVDRCIYNTMADTDECSKQKLSEIRSAHFTVCQKPWTCYPYRTRLCDELRRGWFAMRREAEAFFGLSVQKEVCLDRRYKSMDLDAITRSTSTVLKLDDSPDRILPTRDSGFNEEFYSSWEEHPMD